MSKRTRIEVKPGSKIHLNQSQWIEFIDADKLNTMRCVQYAYIKNDDDDELIGPMIENVTEMNLAQLEDWVEEEYGFLVKINEDDGSSFLNSLKYPEMIELLLESLVFDPHMTDEEKVRTLALIMYRSGKDVYYLDNEIYKGVQKGVSLETQAKIIRYLKQSQLSLDDDIQVFTL